MNTQEIKNSIVQILYWTANVFVTAFTTGYLTTYGFSNLQIGLIMSFSAIFTILFNFYFDEVFNNLVFYHLKRTIIWIYIFCLTICLLFYYLNTANFTSLLLFALLCSLMTHNQRLINILCERQKHEHFLTDGNRPANIGYISYGISTLFFGYLISQTNITIIIPCYILFCTIALLSVLFLLNDEIQQQPVIDIRLEYHDALMILKHNKLFSIFLFASMLSAIGSMSAIKYLVRIINYYNGNSFNLAIALMIQSLITLPITKNSKTIIQKYNASVLLIISFFFSFLKIFILFKTKSLYGIYLSMACSILGYGLFGFSSAAFTRQLNANEDSFYGHRLALLVSSFGFGPLFGGIIGGFLTQFYNLKVLLICCSLLTFLSFIIQTILTIYISRKKAA